MTDDDERITTIVPCKECGETIDSKYAYCDDCRPEELQEEIA